LDKPFEERLQMVKECFEARSHRYAQAHLHQRCRGTEHLLEELAKVTDRDGEGLMLRRPGSRYEAGRSSTLLKVKKFLDGEARVLKHLEGAGRHRNRLGALLVELEDGTTFQVGTGFSDAEREQPPALGSTIAFRYQERSDRGVPRFPSYVGLRAEQPQSLVVEEPGAMMNTQPQTRRFEFSDGKSNKFWSIAVDGSNVTVSFGRIGTTGQTKVKSLPDAAAAAKHAEQLIEEKTGKGYIEV
jgi:DNA ligase-1